MRGEGRGYTSTPDWSKPACKHPPSAVKIAQSLPSNVFGRWCRWLQAAQTAPPKPKQRQPTCHRRLGQSLQRVDIFFTFFFPSFGGFSQPQGGDARPSCLFGQGLKAETHAGCAPFLCLSVAPLKLGESGVSHHLRFFGILVSFCSADGLAPTWSP